MENTTQIKEILKEYYNTLPTPLQYAATSDEVQDMLADIKQKYSLTDEEDITLSNEVLFVLLGFSTQDEFVNNLVSEGVQREKAQLLTNEVQTLIFDPLKPELNELFREVDSEEQQTKEFEPEPPQQKTPTPQPEEEKEDILHDIEEPTKFEVPFHKTTFEEKLEKPVPETKEEMLQDLRTPDGVVHDTPTGAPPQNLPTQEKNDSHDLFPQPKKGDTNTNTKQVSNDPYREPIE